MTSGGAGADDLVRGSLVAGVAVPRPPGEEEDFGSFGDVGLKVRPPKGVERFTVGPSVG